MQISFSKFTDSQWQFIDKIIDDQRKRKHNLRVIVNAIFSINNTGSQWRDAAQRNLDSKYPPWQTVFYYRAAFRFTQFKQRGIWGNILDLVVLNERKRQRRNDTPSLLAIDSQSVKKVQFSHEETGIDGGKNINGLGIPVAKEPSLLIHLVFLGQ
jgi:transposase